MQGFRASHSTACLGTVVLSGLFELKTESWKWKISCELWAVLPKASGSLLEARCVRDWSGILCERNGKWDSGTVIWDWGTGIFERGENEASKDIAESPARSERPDKDNSQRTTDNRQRFQDTESPRCWDAKNSYRDVDLSMSLFCF